MPSKQPDVVARGGGLSGVAVRQSQTGSFWETVPRESQLDGPWSTTKHGQWVGQVKALFGFVPLTFVRLSFVVLPISN